MTLNQIRCRSLIFGCLIFGALTSQVDANNWFLRIKEEGQVLEGDCIHWSSNMFVLLARDGKSWNFDIDRAPDARMIKGQVEPFTSAELRASLLREFGSAYDVTGTGHYLVVHPAGQRNQWANRFESLYREMLHYFTTRGIQTSEPDYPLIAVVFPTQAEFFRNAKGDGVQSGVLGYYHSGSNRVMLYDQSGGRPGVDWRRTSSTVVHEAAHQTAYNTGVHSRWVNTPRWITEGLGTLFEAPGVNSPSEFKDREDRVNRGRLRDYQHYFGKGLPKGTVRQLVASDELFKRKPLPAYAASWALTFMMAEQQPRDLAQYLKTTASKSGFREVVSANDRLRDFQNAFGKDFEMIEARLDRLMRDVE